MKTKDFKEFLPLLIALITILYSIIKVITSDIIFTTPHYIGFFLICISVISFFINRKIYEYIMGGTFTIGVLGLIAFTPSIFSINILGIKFQPYSLVLLLIFLFILKDKYDSKNTNE